MAGSCEHGNKPSGSIKGEGVSGHLRDHKFLSKACTPRSSNDSSYLRSSDISELHRLDQRF
jgi:hypothetical protein